MAKSKPYSDRFRQRFADPTVTGVGADLARLCILHGYSPEEVADIFHVTSVTVYNWMTGRTVPSGPTRAKLDDLIKRIQALPVPNPQPDYIE